MPTTAIPTPDELRARATQDLSLLPRVMAVMTGDPRAPEGAPRRKPQPPLPHPSGLLSYALTVDGAGVDLTKVREALGDAWTAEIEVQHDRRAVVRIIENKPEVLDAWRERVRANENREQRLLEAIENMRVEISTLRKSSGTGYQRLIEGLAPVHQAIAERGADLLEIGKKIEGAIRALGDQNTGVIRSGQRVAEELMRSIDDVRKARASVE